MKLKVTLAKTLTLLLLANLLILSTAAPISAQVNTGNTQKNTAKKETIPAPEQKKNTTADKTEKKEPEKKDTTPVPEDKNKTGTADQKKQEDDPSKKDSAPKKDEKKADVWDDARKARKIESTLEYGMQKDRRTAIIMINEIKDEQIKEKLMQKLAFIIENDSDIEIKKTAVTALGDHKSAAYTPALIKALDDQAEDIKIAACYAIGKIKAEEAKPKLVELFKNQDLKLDSNYTDALIITLYELNSPDILDIAVTAGKDSTTSKMIRERLILYIGTTGSAEQKDFLIELYKNDDEDNMLRSYAIKSIAKLKIKEATDDIKEMIKEIDSYAFNKKKRYYDLYMHSVAALVEMGDTDSIELLMNSLRSDNTAVRLKAVNLIKAFDTERTIDILKYKMKNDPSPKIRKAAKKALEDKGLIEKGKDDEDSKNEYDRDEKDE